MKRILIGGVLAVTLMLIQTSPAPVAQEKEKKGPAWQTVDGFKVLKLWEIPELGPETPQIAILQLSRERQIELQRDPLAFYKEHQIFRPTPCDHAVGQSVFQLVEYKKATAQERVVAIAVHDPGTYCGFSAFEVAYTKP